MKTLLNLIIIAVILFIALCLIAINNTYGQSGRVALMEINNERIYNNIPPISYLDDKERLANKLLNLYIKNGKVSMDKADFCEYYAFEGDEADVEAIIAVACIGKQGWFHEEIKCAVLRFKYDSISDTTLGVGLYFY